MFCSNCGHATRPGSARCGQCNFKLPDNPLPSASPASALVACWNCAHANPPEALRCTHCNAKTEGQSGEAQADDRFSFTQYAVSHDE